MFASKILLATSLVSAAFGATIAQREERPGFNPIVSTITLIAPPINTWNQLLGDFPASQLQDVINYGWQVIDNAQQPGFALQGFEFMYPEGFLPEEAASLVPILEGFVPNLESALTGVVAKKADLEGAGGSNTIGTIRSQLNAISNTFNGLLSRLSADFPEPYKQQVLDLQDQLDPYFTNAIAAYAA